MGQKGYPLPRPKPKPPSDPFTPQQPDKSAPILPPVYLTEGYDPPCKYCGNKLKSNWLFGKPTHGGCVNEECKNYWEDRIPREGYNPFPLERLNARPDPVTGHVITEGIKPPSSRGKKNPAGEPGFITNRKELAKEIKPVFEIPADNDPYEYEAVIEKSTFPKFTFTPTFDMKINNFSLGIIVGIIITLLLKGC